MGWLRPVCPRSGAFDLIVERHRPRRVPTLLSVRRNHETRAICRRTCFLRAYRWPAQLPRSVALATLASTHRLERCLNRVGANDTLRKLTEPNRARRFRRRGRRVAFGSVLAQDDRGRRAYGRRFRISEQTARDADSAGGPMTVSHQIADVLAARSRGEGELLSALEPEKILEKWG